MQNWKHTSVAIQSAQWVALAPADSDAASGSRWKLLQALMQSTDPQVGEDHINLPVNENYE